ENHTHHSSYNFFLTLKTFIFTALIAYLGPALSAFVYVPFGEGLMRIVQARLFDRFVPHTGSHYTVTNQIVSTFVEIGILYVLPKITAFRTKKADLSIGTGSLLGKRKVVFEDEKGKGGQAEKEFLDQARAEAASPAYDAFGGYSDMVIQFGYVALWSTSWPLPPVMAPLNNLLKLSSDVFKITVHEAVRTDTTGPWFEALGSLSWHPLLFITQNPAGPTSLCTTFRPSSTDACIWIHHVVVFASSSSGVVRSMTQSDEDAMVHKSTR
ncbi:calcium-activated chloride channel-domain-containing protein, partial [Lentinula lateritia]